MLLKGKVHKFGDDISTDLIIPGRYFHLRNNLDELAKYTLEDLDPDFLERLKVGDFVVAGKNFGMGSSREHAPLVMKINGVGVVLAKSFARIFFRNAINVGLPVLECNTDMIDKNDILEIDLDKGKIHNIKKGTYLEFHPLPQVMIDILNAGGLVEYINKYGDFKISD